MVMHYKVEIIGVDSMSISPDYPSDALCSVDIAPFVDLFKGIVNSKSQHLVLAYMYYIYLYGFKISGAQL